MAKIQQEVLIYKEKALATAQNQFEKDLKKRQKENWRLISVTPTMKKGFGRIVQLTAIYERDAIDSNDISENDQYPVSANGESILVQKMGNNAKEKTGMWEKIKESNRRNLEKEQIYQSTLNAEQLRKHKRKNFLIGSVTMIVVLALCIGMAQAVAHSQDMQVTSTSQPTDTATPISLTTHQEIEAYGGQILDSLSPTPYGNREGIAFATDTKELQATFYIPSSQVFDNNNLKNMIEINCFNTQKAFWTSRLKEIVSSVTIHIQSDLVDKYGNQSKGEVGTATLTVATNNMINWDNIDFGSAWDNQIYNEQWMLPSVEKS